MNKKNWIKSFLVVSHSGEENAIPRDVLLVAIYNTFPDITDRELRSIYSEFACTSDKGVFIPATQEELARFKIYLRKKAIAIFERYKKVAKNYPELLSPKERDEINQMELFQ